MSLANRGSVAASTPPPPPPPQQQQQQQQQHPASPSSGLSFPISPRSSLPSYVRRSSLLSSVTNFSHASSSHSSSSASYASSATLVNPPPSHSSSSSSAPHHAVAAAGNPPHALASSSSSSSTLLDRPRDRSRNAAVSASALSFLYAEVVSYTQDRVSGIADLEKKLSLLGYHIGQRYLPLLSHRIELPLPPSASGGSSSSYNRNPKREVRLLPVLLWIHTQLWRNLFGRPADSLERSTERSDEYMISTNQPTFSAGVAVPRDMSQLSVEAITAGIVEAVLDGLGFPAHVSAHNVATPEQPKRTTILIKLSRDVIEREEALGPA